MVIAYIVVKNIILNGQIQLKIKHYFKFNKKVLKYIKTCRIFYLSKKIFNKKENQKII